MPSQQEVKWSQLKVGIIVLISTALLCILLFLMTSASGMSLFSKKLTVTTYFENAAGLKTGAPVNLQGVTIGEVKSVVVSTDPERKLTPVKVTMRLEPKFHASLHTDSKASLSTVGVLGDTVIDINSETAVGPELQDHAELKTLEQPNLQDVIKSSQGTVESLNQILAKMDRIVDAVQTGKGSAGQLVNDPALYNKAVATVNELQVLVANLNNGRGSAGKILHDDQLYDRLNDTSMKLDQIASDINAGKGSAGKLLKDDSLYNNLNSTLVHANSLLAEADAGKGALGMMVKDPAFARKLDDTVTKLDSLLTGVDKGEGTLGKFAKDDAAYNNLNKLLTESTTLVATIRQDPKKYLTIHLKIF
ncbi:MAG TPA: MlaD family protein [Acidobacteriaceae bacterium]|jgi:phospholipid/cholesterol/gamma-HCH transport system substrate-binding protein